MNKMREVIKGWEAKSRAKPAVKEVTVHLTLRDAAKIRALRELYPGLPEEHIITDIICSALYEIEEALAYVKGERIIAEDEFGDPIYEDIGKTPRFQQLTNEYSALLAEELKEHEKTTMDS